jgi:toxin-antitoxin system PIN domain toxin
MRTTLTLDDDVAAVLERLRKSRNASLKDLVNEALRRGLKDMSSRTKRRERLRTRSLRHCRGRSLQVILVDANILIYAHVSSFAQHSIARGWLDQQLNGSGPVGLPWASMLAFLRLVTNPRVFERPEPIGDAWQQLHAWLACETAWIPQPTERHAELLGQFLTLPGIHGNLIPDAHLAALAVEHGLMLCSTDGDFARFRGLRWLNPITP